jgi:hypothetical protein
VSLYLEDSMKQFNATMRKQLNATTRTTLTRDCFLLKAGRSEHYSFISFSLSVLLLLSLFLDYPSMHHCIRLAPTTQHPLFVNHLTKSSTTQYTPLPWRSLGLILALSPRFIPFYSCFFLIIFIICLLSTLLGSLYQRRHHTLLSLRGRNAFGF